jgi:hypothetical protein
MGAIIVDTGANQLCCVSSVNDAADRTVWGENAFPRGGF